MSNEHPYWRTRPGGLSSVAFAFPSEPVSAYQTGYYNFDFFITVTKDPGTSLTGYPIPADVRGSESVLGYYWANQFAFVGGNVNGVDGYMGIQTFGSICTFDPMNRNDASRNRLVKQTRLAIFSIWGALDATPGFSNSYCAPFAHEGSGWSCTLEYPWVEGVKYCLSISKLPDSAKPNKPEWWRGAIIDTATHQEAIIGDIKVPAQWSWLRKDAGCFTEYLTQTVNQTIGDSDDGQLNPRVCQFMPKAEVLIHPPKANNRSIDVLAMTPKNYGKCAGVSSFVWLLDGSVVKGLNRLSPPRVLINRTGSISVSN